MTVGRLGAVGDQLLQRLVQPGVDEDEPGIQQAGGHAPSPGQGEERVGSQDAAP